MEAVQSMNEFILVGRNKTALGTMMGLMDVLLWAVHELILLICEAVVKVLTTDRMIVGVDLDVFQALTAQRKLMLINILRTLK